VRWTRLRRFWRYSACLRTGPSCSSSKHLLTHHDQREANILYPALDRVTSAAERRALLAACGITR